MVADRSEPMPTPSPMKVPPEVCASVEEVGGGDRLRLVRPTDRPMISARMAEMTVKIMHNFLRSGFFADFEAEGEAEGVLVDDVDMVTLIGWFCVGRLIFDYE